MGDNCETQGCGGSCACESKSCGCGQENCSCEAKSCGCGTENCGCGAQCGSGDFYEAMQEKLIGMAAFAHKSALFDRIRARVEKVEGAKLDRIAELVVEASLGKFKDAQEAERKGEELRAKLREIMEE